MQLSGGGGGSVVHIHLDARGTDGAAVARIEGAMEALTRNFDGLVIGAVSDAKARGGSFGNLMRS